MLDADPLDALADDVEEVLETYKINTTDYVGVAQSFQKLSSNDQLNL